MTNETQQQEIDAVRARYEASIPSNSLLARLAYLESGLMIEAQRRGIPMQQLVGPPVTPEPVESEEDMERRYRRDSISADGLTAAVAQYALSNIELKRDARVVEFIEVMEPRMDLLLAPFKHGVLVKSRRTQQEYVNDYNKFRRYFADAGIVFDMPVRPELVAIYIMAAAEDGASYASISRAVTAIDNVHDVCRKQSPSNNPTVKAALKYAASLKNARRKK